MPPEFLPEVCKVKHDVIDKDIVNIKNNIDEIKKNGDQQHEEIKNLIENLKNKIVLVNKSMGDKIDDLNDFDKELRGNGDPGIWECVRNIKRNVKIMMAILIIIVVLVLGGNYKGISVDSLQKKLGIDNKETKQVGIVSKNIKEHSNVIIPKE